MPRPIVLIADDHQLVAEGIAHCVRAWYDVVGIITAFDEIEGAVRELAPDVLILDLVFGKYSGMSIIPVAIRASNSTRVVILTAHHTVSLADAAIEAGAHAFILKAGMTDELKEGLAQALRGEPYISPLVYSLQPEPVPGALRVTLSEIETSMLDALCAGSTQKEAAACVDRTRKDVEYHLLRLRNVLGFTRTTQLVGWYQRQGGAL